MSLELAAESVLEKNQLALIVDSEGQGVVLGDAKAIKDSKTNPCASDSEGQGVVLGHAKAIIDSKTNPCASNLGSSCTLHMCSHEFTYPHAPTHRGL